MRAVFQSFTALLALAAAAEAAFGQDQMPWQPNLETAQRVAAQTNRLVLIHFWAPWCHPCQRLEREVFSNPETARGLEANFVMVKLNADEAPGTARLYGVSSLPTDVITTSSGRLVSQVQSPPTSTQYVAQMNQAAAGHRSLARKPDPQAAQQTAPPAAPGSAPPPTSGAAYGPQGQAGQTVAQPPAYNPQAGAPYATPNDRYAEYFPDGQHPQPPSNQPYNQVTPAQGYAAAPGAAESGVNPYSADPYAGPAQRPAVNRYVAAPPTAQPPAVDPYAATQPTAAPYQAPPPPANTAQASNQPPPNAPQLPAGCPPIGLDGNCPVTVVERKRWTLGHPSYGAVHRGRTYLFLGPQEKEKFLADPDRYSPVLSGMDPVLALENQVAVPGRREFGVFGADGHIYLFADEASRARFEANEQTYATRALEAIQPQQYQAMRPGR